MKTPHYHALATGCLDTLDKGVRKIHIIDGRMRHSLMLEIYTNKGIGTEIVAS